MDAVDTNVLVRWLIQDDAEQAAQAEALITNATAPLFVSDVVLCEVMWVLRSYKVPRDRLVDVVAQLVNGEEFGYQDRSLLQRAVAGFRSGQADFSDYVILERANEVGGRLFTFDLKLQGAGALSPISG
jgi:predicted nucleic-acid-binding protein